MNSRLYISDTFPLAEVETADSPRYRSVIVATASEHEPSAQEIEDQQRVALAALGTLAVASGVAMIPDGEVAERPNSHGEEIQMLPRQARWREVQVSAWDELHGPHQVDLVDAPSHDETVLLVRVCGLSPLGAR